MHNIPVLMYHRIGSKEEKSHSKYVVHVDDFRAQLRYFAEQDYYTPLLSDALANSTSILTNKKKPLLITFDDGYLDTYEQALPALRDFGFKAIVFVVTDLSRRTNWWDVPKHIAEARLMDPHHMHEMRAHGIEFGSHGVSHRSLPLLSDDDLQFELHQSKIEAEKIFGQPIPYFAYPYGEVDERVKVATIGAGYSCAFASNSGPLSFHTDLFEIRRVLIASSAHPAYLYLKLSGVEKAFKWSEWVGKKVLGNQPAYTF